MPLALRFGPSSQPRVSKDSAFLGRLPEVFFVHRSHGVILAWVRAPMQPPSPSSDLEPCHFLLWMVEPGAARRFRAKTVDTCFSRMTQVDHFAEFSSSVQEVGGNSEVGSPVLCLLRQDPKAEGRRGVLK
jgi:hypothetical protein